MNKKLTKLKNVYTENESKIKSQFKNTHHFHPQVLDKSDLKFSQQEVVLLNKGV